MLLGQTQDRLILGGWLCVVSIPIILWFARRGVTARRTHASYGHRLVNRAGGLPEWTMTTLTGRSLVFLLVLAVGVTATSWSFWEATRGPLDALVLLAVSLAGGWAVVFGAVMLTEARGFGNAGPARLVIGLAVALMTFGVWSYLESAPRVTTPQINPGGPPIWVTRAPMALERSHSPVQVSSGSAVSSETARIGTAATVAVDVANVRSSPSIAAGVLEQVKYGTELQIIGQNADWFQVKLPDQSVGWVAAGWIVTAGS